MAMRKYWTRRAVMTLALSGVLSALAGCGGGNSGGGSTGTRATAPTDTTRSRVQTLHDLALRGMLQSGFQSDAMAMGRNGYFKGAPETTMPAIGGGFGPMPPGARFRPMPMVGAFLRRIAMVAPVMRDAAIARVSRGEETRPSDGGIIGGPEPYPDDPPPPPLENPSFYYDYYLGLWVQVDESPGKSLYLLFEDEEKTLAAGSIETIYPTDWDTFPQVYKSTYEFTAGFLTGSHGSSESVTNEDFSGTMRHENVYADGWKDKGEANWTGRGDYSWTSRTETGEGQWMESSGTFRADGSGGNRYETSEGYAATYTYNADGSGHARITGPDPGLPVTITWDQYGNTIIQYADGTIERIPGWGGYYGGSVGGSPGFGGGGIGFVRPAGGSAEMPVKEPPPPPRL